MRRSRLSLTRSPARGRRGFSLAEIMVALVILSVIVVGLASTTVTFLHETTVDTVRVQASAIADTRIAEIRSWPVYDTLTTFNETKANWPSPGWTRTTTVTRDQSAATNCNIPPCPANDLTKVVVTVTAPGLSSPVVRTFSIAAF